MEDKKKDVSTKRDDKDKAKGNGKSSAKVSSKNEQGPSGSSVSKRSANGDKHSDADVPNAKPTEQPVLDKILAEIRSLGKKQNEMGIQMDSQAAHIQHLDDEWNIKTGQGGLKVSKGNNAMDSDDSDDEKLATIASSVASDRMEDGELDEDDNLDEALFGREKKGIVPTAEEVELFKKLVKLADENGDDEWATAVKAKGAVDFWVGKPQARDFAGPKPDVDTPDLKYKNKKQAEKDMAAVQRVAGAISFAEIRLAEDVKALVTNANITMGEFADPEVEMVDARQEAAVAMENVKETAGGMLKTVGAIGKMANFAYVKLLAMRRKQYTEAVDKSRGAQEMVKRLKPSTAYLFGDQIKTVCRTLKDGSQLNNPLQKNYNRGGGGARGRGYIARGYRGFRGFRGKGGKGRGYAKKDG